MNLYNPWEEIDRMKSDMERLFGRFTGKTPWRLAFLPGSDVTSMPRINISESPEGYVIKALAPGLKMDTLDVTVHGTLLTIKGEKNAPEGVNPSDYQRSERSLGKFERTISLKRQLDPEKVKAVYADGILTIELEKAEIAKPRQITVQVG